MPNQPEDYNPSLDILGDRMRKLYERAEYAKTQGLESIIIQQEDFEALMAGMEIAAEL